jgi:hypothetical protein
VAIDSINVVIWNYRTSREVLAVFERREPHLYLGLSSAY